MPPSLPRPTPATPDPAAPTVGLLLFAHGARDPRWSAPFEAVAEQLRALRPRDAVRLAFLEFMTPSLGQAGAELVRLGCRHVQVLPMFLGAGGHVRKDLPALVQALRDDCPQTTFTLHTAVGEDPGVIAAMASWAAASADGAPR